MKSKLILAEHPGKITVLLGVGANSVVNFVFMLAKFHIYNCMIKSKCPNVSELLYIAKETEMLERHIAYSHNKLATHEAKWTWFLEDTPRP